MDHLDYSPREPISALSTPWGGGGYAQSRWILVCEMQLDGVADVRPDFVYGGALRDNGQVYAIATYPDCSPGCTRIWMLLSTCPPLCREGAPLREDQASPGFGNGASQLSGSLKPLCDDSLDVPQGIQVCGAVRGAPGSSGTSAMKAPSSLLQ